jgi:hypothetical protein
MGEKKVNKWQDTTVAIAVVAAATENSATIKQVNSDVNSNSSSIELLHCQ